MTKKNRRTMMRQGTALTAGLLTTNLHAEETKVKEPGISFHDVSSKLVLVEFEHNEEPHRALGVVALMDGKPYLLTNQHILLGAQKLRFTTAAGKKLAPRSVELSNSRDLVRLALPEGTHALKIMETKARMNTAVTLINADSDNKKRIQKGTIIGIGGLKFEISAD